MNSLQTAHLRVARPTSDMDAAVRFWVEGLGMTLEGRKPTRSDTTHELAFIGWPGGTWHLELILDSEIAPAPTDEDLLVLYLGGPIDDAFVAQVERAGGRRVAARNPYWDEHGITIADPDGFRLVLSTRAWT